MLLWLSEGSIWFCTKSYISSNHIAIFNLATLVIENLAYVIVCKVPCFCREQIRSLSGVGRGSNYLLINVSPATTKRRNACLAQILRRAFTENAEGYRTGLLDHELHLTVLCRQSCHFSVFLSSVLPYLSALGRRKEMVGRAGRETASA